MSHSSVSTAPQSFAPAPSDYQLSDDLARLCLPHEFKDSYRKLAWANSVCFLFLVIGLIGLKSPRVFVRPLSAVVDTAPVVFTPPEEQPKPPEVKPDEQEPPPEDTAVDAPQIAPVVAVMPSPGVAFAVPVTGAVAVATSVRAATPPPPPNSRPAAPKPKVFIPGQGEGGTFPWPHSYPREALEEHAQGTVTLYVEVDATGAPSKVEVKDTSRYHVLDQYALQWVKRNWKWLPGEVRYFYVPFEFKLQ